MTDLSVIVELDRIEKKYMQGKEKKNILKNISFALDRGSCTGLIGQSGAGKSTLAKIIAGITPPDAGQIRICGQELIAAQKESCYRAWRCMQLVFQNPYDAFDPRKTIGWSLQEGLKNKRFSTACIDQKIDQILLETGLSSELIYRHPHEISGGECQRAAIARAVLLEPELLLCDEITSALDAAVQRDICALLRKICRSHQMTCLFISHDIDAVRQLCDFLLVLSDGEIAEFGKTEELLENPQSVWLKQIVEAEKFFTCKGESYGIC